MSKSNQGASNINQEIREGEAQSINLASIIVEENKTIIYDASSFKILPPEEGYYLYIFRENGTLDWRSTSPLSQEEARKLYSTLIREYYYVEMRLVKDSKMYILTFLV